jgi:hypothetical protein
MKTLAISILAVVTMTLGVGKAWAVCQPDDDECYCRTHPGECDDAPPLPATWCSSHRNDIACGSNPTTPQAANAQAAVGMGYTPDTPRMDGCINYPGEDVCRTRVRVADGLVASFSCDVTTTTVYGPGDPPSWVETHVTVSNCHLE